MFSTWMFVMMFACTRTVYEQSSVPDDDGDGCCRLMPIGHCISGVPLIHHCWWKPMKSLDHDVNRYMVLLNRAHPRIATLYHLLVLRLRLRSSCLGSISWHVQNEKRKDWKNGNWEKNGKERKMNEKRTKHGQLNRKRQKRRKMTENEKLAHAQRRWMDNGNREYDWPGRWSDRDRRRTSTKTANWRENSWEQKIEETDSKSLQPHLVLKCRIPNVMPVFSVSSPCLLWKPVIKYRYRKVGKVTDFNHEFT